MSTTDLPERAKLARSLLLLPLTSLILAAERNGLSARLVELGLDEQFALDLNQQIEQAGSAIVFLIVDAASRDRLLEMLASVEGTVLRTSVSIDADFLGRLVQDRAAPE